MKNVPTFASYPQPNPSAKVVPVPDRRDDLEARVARLELLLDQVLGTLQEKRDEEDGRGVSAKSDVPAEAPSGAGGRPEPEPEGPPSEAPSSTLGAPRVAPPGVDTEALKDFLERLGIYPLRGVFLARLGIVLLLLSVAYFFKYSIDQGWLVPVVRLAIGVGVGIGLVSMGFKGASKGEPLGTVLAGGGIATFFITGYTGHQWYSLVSYPVAFGFLLAASALGIFLSLRSGLQALALVGLIGALGTPLILTSQATEVAGLALYVSLIVASVCAIYLLKAWRALIISGAVTAWAVLGLAVSITAPAAGVAGWTVQGSLVVCALLFWVVPLYRAAMRGKNPEKWPLPAGVNDDWTWRSEGSWSLHLDALTLLMPLTAVAFTGWLWDLNRFQLGWVVFAAALLAQGVGSWLNRTPDPEDSAPTQRFVALLLTTFGLGLVLTGDVLYLAFIAEGVALFWGAARRKSRLLLGFGVAVQLVVLFLFLLRFSEYRLGGAGTVTLGPDLVAIGAAGFIGARIMGENGRRIFYTGAYLALLSLIGWELREQSSILYLAYLLLAVGTQFLAVRVRDQVLERLSYVAFGLVVLFFLFGLTTGRTILGGDLTLLIDLAALLGTVYLGINAGKPELRLGLLAGAYVGLLAVLGRELQENPTLLYLVVLCTAVLTQAMASRSKSTFWTGLGHLPMVIVLGFFGNGWENGRNLLSGDVTSFVDLAAIGSAAYIGTLLTPGRGRGLYLFGAYAWLLLWVGRELYPFEQGQAWMSLAFGLQGAVALVAAFILNRSALQKLGVATLLLVVGKVLLVDMAAVEPIWRVLLLFAFGGLFLLLSKFVQGRKPREG